MINEWTEISPVEIDSWNGRLNGTTASYRQYPFWNEPYRSQGFAPVYVTYGNKDSLAAYACVITKKLFGVQIGLLQSGPVCLEENRSLDGAALKSLRSWALSRGYTFLRVSHPEQEILQLMTDSGLTERVESFPFYRDPRNKLFVNQVTSEEEMLASFQSVARYEIRAAIRAGYEIRVVDDCNELIKVWPMFEKLALRKGFELSKRSLAGWLEVFRQAGKHDCAKLYQAFLDGECIQSIFVIKYGNTAEYMLGALDIERLNKRVSPGCLLHWRAMRDFYKLGCSVYNLGGPGNKEQVYQFKRKFHPVLYVNPEPVTLVLNSQHYRLWSKLVLNTLVPWRSRVRRLVTRFRTGFRLALAK
jgi:lipid II:glycine glycyltransferase (peptidoglycan interpeptide bridge formation enzyme)